MAKTETKTEIKQDIDTLLQDFLKSGFTELRLERTIFKPEVLQGVPLTGYLADVIDMPPLNKGTKNEREWKSLLFVTTRATKAIDRHGDVVDVKVGEEVIIPATHQLLTSVARFAANPKTMVEVCLIADKKIDIGGGQTMWTYRALINEKSVKERTGPYVLQPARTGAVGELSDGTTFDPSTGVVVEKAPVARA